jgi:hypothetical protein
MRAMGRKSVSKPIPGTREARESMKHAPLKLPIDRAPGEFFYVYYCHRCESYDCECEPYQEDDL